MDLRLLIFVAAQTHTASTGLSTTRIVSVRRAVMFAVSRMSKISLCLLCGTWAQTFLPIGALRFLTACMARYTLLSIRFAMSDMSMKLSW